MVVKINDTNFLKAKQSTLAKWLKIHKDLVELDQAMRQRCGFCDLVKFNCKPCPAYEICTGPFRAARKHFTALCETIWELESKLANLTEEVS